MQCVAAGLMVAWVLCIGWAWGDEARLAKLSVVHLVAYAVLWARWIGRGCCGSAVARSRTRQGVDMKLMSSDEYLDEYGYAGDMRYSRHGPGGRSARL